jgi:hypothetical protein
MWQLLLFKQNSYNPKNRHCFALPYLHAWPLPSWRGTMLLLLSWLCIMHN